MDGPLPPCVVGRAVCVEGPLPPCVTTGPASLVTMGGGGWLMAVFMIVLGPLSRLWVIGCDVDMGLLAMDMPKNGFRFALAMGLDGAVWRPSSD